MDLTRDWNHLLGLVLRYIPAGPLLDNLVLQQRPAPGIIGAMPSPEVFERLARERNLYGASLHAAITPDIESVLSHAYGNKDRVLRALALNSTVPDILRETWLLKSAKKNDIRWGMALLLGAPDIFACLAKNPKIAGKISTRVGQPGPLLLAQRAQKSTASSLDMAGETATQDVAYLVKAIFARFRLDISADTYITTLPLVLALCRHLQGINTDYRRGVAVMPRYLKQILLTRPGIETFQVLTVFSIPTDTTEMWPLHRASDFSSQAVLDSVPTRLQRPNLQMRPLRGQARYDGFRVSEWSQEAQNFLAYTVANHLETLAEVEIFKTLIQEWKGNVSDLLNAAKLL